MKELTPTTSDIIRGLLRNPENPALINYEAIHTAWISALVQLDTQKQQKPFCVNEPMTLITRAGKPYPALFQYSAVLEDNFPEIEVCIFDSWQQRAAHRYWNFAKNSEHIDATSFSRSYPGYEGEGLSISLTMLTNEVLPHVATHFSYWWGKKPIIATIHDAAYSPNVDRIGWTTQVAQALGYIEDIDGDFQKLYPTPGYLAAQAK